MTDKLTDLTLVGVTRIGSSIGSDFVYSMRLGANTPNYTSGAGSLYAATAEINGTAYLGSPIFYVGTTKAILASGNANALRFGIGPGTTITSGYLKFDTANGNIEAERQLHFTTKSGIYNAATSTILATEQEKWVRFTVSADSGAAGMGRIRNTFGTGYAITDAILNVKAAATGASHIHAGVTSGATSTVGNLFNAVSVTAAGAHFYALSAGASGTSGAPLNWATNHYLNITASAVGTPGGGSFSGTVMLKIKRIE